MTVSLRIRRSLVALLATVGMLVFAPGPASSAPQPTEKPAAPRPGSLDDELLKDLLGEEPAAPPAKPATPPPAEPDKPKADSPKADSVKSDDAKPGAKPQGKRPASPLDDELMKDLGGESSAPGQAAAGEKGDDPLSRLNREMRDVEQRLQDSKSGDETQAKQRQIVDDLTQLIKKSQQQQQQNGPGGSSQKQQGTAARDKVQQPGAEQRQQAGPQQVGQKQQPQTQPARDSSDKLTQRDTEKVDMAEMQDLLKHIWGELPPRLRQQMMQSNVEKFLPKYESMIEEYFKALAEKQE